MMELMFILMVRELESLLPQQKQLRLLSRFGDTQLDTAQKKFGTASILFDGTEDNLRFLHPKTMDLVLQTGVLKHSLDQIV